MWPLDSMPRWRRRVLAYRLIDTLPGGAWLFDWVRLRAGGLRNFDLDRRAYTFDHISELLRQAGRSVRGCILAEVGSGWHPVLPAVFHGLGAREIRMTDIVVHLRQEFVDATLDYLMSKSQLVAERFGVDEAELTSRWQALRPGNRPWREVWRTAGIEYHAPFDFTATGWAPGTVDMVFSNSCLGYIPQPILTGIFREMARILRPGGWIAHDISLSDDYSGYDSSITPLNFFYYSAEDWDRVGNCRLHYQNRLRPRDYEELTRAVGMQVRVSERLRKNLRPEMLERDRLAPEFRDYPEEDLLTAHHLLLADKAQT